MGFKVHHKIVCGSLGHPSYVSLTFHWVILFSHPMGVLQPSNQASSVCWGTCDVGEREEKGGGGGGGGKDQR